MALMSPSEVPVRKLNLLIVASGLGIGGAESVMQQLAETIDRSRFNVTVCCLKVLGVVGNELVRRGIEVVTLSEPSERKANYFLFLRLWRLIRLKQIDVVHTHTTDGLTDAALCKVLRPGLTLVHTFHFGNYPHLRSRQLWMERVGSRLADRLLAVGETQRHQLRTAYGFSEARIATVRNGVPPSSGRDDGSFRASVGAGRRLLVGTMASLIQQKGLPDLIEVAARFRHRRDELCFIVVGEGYMRAELERLRREHDLDDMVVFTGWVPNAADVALPAFDVFFQPSLWEAMSVALLEAMAAAKPIVATRVGEAPFVLEDGGNALLVNAKDIDGMTFALTRVIDNAHLRRTLGCAAKRTVNEHFTVAGMTREYEEIYLKAGGWT